MADSLADLRYAFFGGPDEEAASLQAAKDAGVTLETLIGLDARVTTLEGA